MLRYGSAKKKKPWCSCFQKEPPASWLPQKTDLQRVLQHYLHSSSLKWIKAESLPWDDPSVTGSNHQGAHFHHQKTLVSVPSGEEEKKSAKMEALGRWGGRGTHGIFRKKHTIFLCMLLHTQTLCLFIDEVLTKTAVGNAGLQNPPLFSLIRVATHTPNGVESSRFPLADLKSFKLMA